MGVLENSTEFATLSERVGTNEKAIIEVKDGQALLSANLTAWRNEMTATMDQILRAVGADFEDGE